MNKRVFAYLIVFGLFTSYGAASDLSLFAGWNQTGSLKLRETRVNLDDFTLFGVRYEKTFLAFLGLENTLAFSTNSLVPEGSDGSAGLTYTSNLVFNVPLERVVPFATAGVGVLRKFDNDSPGDFLDVGTSFLTNYGVGLKVRNLIGPAGLRVDYRRFTIYDIFDENVSINEVSGGVVFSF